jgi:hypothetical protein
MTALDASNDGWPMFKKPRCVYWCLIQRVFVIVLGIVSQTWKVDDDEEEEEDERSRTTRGRKI